MRLGASSPARVRKAAGRAAGVGAHHVLPARWPAPDYRLHCRRPAAFAQRSRLAPAAPGTPPSRPRAPPETDALAPAGSPPSACESPLGAPRCWPYRGGCSGCLRYSRPRESRRRWARARRPSRLWAAPIPPVCRPPRRRARQFGGGVCCSRGSEICAPGASAARAKAAGWPPGGISKTG